MTTTTTATAFHERRPPIDMSDGRTGACLLTLPRRSALSLATLEVFTRLGDHEADRFEHDGARVCLRTANSVRMLDLRGSELRAVANALLLEAEQVDAERAARSRRSRAA